MAIPNDLLVFRSRKGPILYWIGWDKVKNEPITTADIRKAAKFSATKAIEELMTYHAQLLFFESVEYPKDLEGFDDEETFFRKHKQTEMRF